MINNNKMRFNYKTHYLVTLLVIGMKKPNRKHFHKYLCNKKFLLAIIGLTIAMISVVMYFTFPSILRHLVEQKINLEKDGEFYNWWIKPSTPTEVGIYFFHVENPYEVENGAENIKVKEMGKYMFKQYYEREIVGYSPKRDTITFYEKRIYVFDEQKTNGSLDDRITVINIPYAALGSIIPKVVDHLPIPNFLNVMAYSYINEFLENHNQSLFVNTTIRDLIYGYKLDILDTAQGFAESLADFGAHHIMPTHSFPNNSFGILNGRNGSRDGPFEMYTGVAGTKQLFGHIKSWREQTQLKWWKSDKCNAIKGTDGTIWPKPIEQSEKLYFYVPDVCRSIYVTYQNESSIKGIKTLRYSSSKDVLAGIDTNPENECFCVNENKNRCRLDGIFDVSACQSDIPIIISYPHFLGADSQITDKIDGLKPDTNLHQSVIHVEPVLGAVIHGHSSLQMSIRVPKNKYIRGFENLSGEMYVPLFWGYKNLGISDEFAAELKTRLYKPVIAINYIIIFGIITGFLLFFTFVSIGILCQTQEKKAISLYDDVINTVNINKVPQNNNDMNNILRKQLSSRSSQFEYELLLKSETAPETNV